MLLLNNLVFSNFNYPRNLNVLLNSDESLLIGTDSVVFSWDEPEDNYRLTFLIDNIDDNGDGSVDFDVSFLRDNYFPTLRAFNIGIRNGDANLQINSINGGFLESLNWSKNVNSNVIQANNVDWVLYLEYDDCGLDGICQYFKVVDIDTEENCESVQIGGTWIDGDCVSSRGTCDNTGHLNPNWTGQDTGECNNTCEDQEQALSWVDQNGDDDCGYYFEYEEMQSLSDDCPVEFISQREWNFNDLNGNQVCDQDVIIDENTELSCNEVGGNWSGGICTIDECESYSTCHLFTMSGTYDVEYDQIFYIEHDYDETILYHTSETEPIVDFQWLPTLWQPGNNIDSTHKYLNLDINNKKTLLQFYFNPFDRNSNEREIKYFLKTNLDLENFYIVVQKHIGADAFKTNLNNIEEISDEFGVKYLRSKITELNSSDSLLIKVDYINFSKRTTIDILNDKFVDDKDNVNIEKNVNKLKSNKSDYDLDKYFNNKLKIFFLLSLFTIIVIIIYSFYYNRNSDLDKFVTCKHCQKIIKQTDNFCPFCGGENVS